MAQRRLVKITLLGSAVLVFTLIILIISRRLDDEAEHSKSEPAALTPGPSSNNQNSDVVTKERPKATRRLTDFPKNNLDPSKPSDSPKEEMDDDPDDDLPPDDPEAVRRVKLRPAELKLHNGRVRYQGVIEEFPDVLYKGKKSYKLLTVKLERWTTYQIDLISKEMQAFLHLEDPDGNVVMENSSPRIGALSRTMYTPSRAGTYRLVATSLAGFRTGSFSCTVRVFNPALSERWPIATPSWLTDLDADGDGQVSLHEWLDERKDLNEFRKYDLNGDSVITAEEFRRYIKKPVELGLKGGRAKYQGDIEEVPDETYKGKKSFKILTVKLEAGKTYLIEQTSKVMQAFIHLEGPNGNVVMENSSPNIGGLSRIVCRADQFGTYRIIATSLAGFRTGAFSCSVRAVSPLLGGVLPNVLPQWFHDLDANGEYRIDLPDWQKAGKDPDEFRKYDLNQDGTITADELVRYLKKPVELRLKNGRTSYNGALTDAAGGEYRGKVSYKIFTVRLDPDHTYRIELNSQAFQSFLYLEDSAGNLLEENSSPNVGGKSSLFLRADHPGAYRIVATSQAGVRAGNFSLSIRRGKLLPKCLPPWFEDLDNDGDGQITLQEWRSVRKKDDEFRQIDLNADGSITPDEVLAYLKKPAELQFANGQANFSGTVSEMLGEEYHGKKAFKFLTIWLEQGTYQIDHISPAFQARVYVEGPTGEVLAKNSSPGVGKNARVVFRASEAGTYRVIATSDAGVRTGDFSLSVRLGRILPEGLPSWFRDLDTDNDGQINLRESLEGGMTLVQFHKIDVDDDGFITPAELLRYLAPKRSKLPKGLPPWFEILDHDGDGQISILEWREGGANLDNFRQFDLNDDGLITADEVLQYLKK